MFLASGQALAVAGPVGALFGYLLMSALTASVALTIGELCAFMPVTGGFIRHASRFIQPAMGAATGWNYCKKLAKLHETVQELTNNSSPSLFDGHHWSS